MALPLGAFSRDEAESRSHDAGEHRTWKAYHWRFQWNGASVRVKDVRNCAPLFRWTLGRFLVRHEARMYERLKGLNFAPRCYGMLDGDALMLEDVAAPSLGQVRRPQLDAAFLDRLLACIKSLHAMGVVHLDLRSRRNVLVTGDNEPKLIDFANALYLGEGSLARRILVPLLGAIDHSAVLKFRHREFPESLTPAQRARYARFRRWRRFWPFGSKARKTKRNGQVEPVARIPAGRESTSAAGGNGKILLRIAGELDRLRAIVAEPCDRTSKAQRIAEAIRDFRNYRRVGFYDVTPTTIGVVGWSGPGAGIPRFPNDQSLCTRAIRERATVVVGDVRCGQEDPATSDGTASEMIVPVWNGPPGTIVGLIDVESERQDAFTADDRAMVEAYASIVAPFWK